MRFLRYIPVFLLSLNTFGQWTYREDTSCYSLQKICIPYDALNETEYGEAPGPEDLFSHVYYLNTQAGLQIDFLQESERPILPDFSEIERGLNQNPAVHTYYDLEMTQEVHAYRMIRHGGIQYDEYGEPLIQINELGDVEYLWEASDSIIVTFYVLSDVHLTIEKRMDLEGEVYDVRTLSFVMTGPFGDKRVVFSLSMDEFMQKMNEMLANKRMHLPWYEKLVNDSFKGFRFHQIPCAYPIGKD